MPAFLLLLIADLAVVAVVAAWSWPLVLLYPGATGLQLEGGVLGAVFVLGLLGALVSRATLKARASSRLRTQILTEPQSSAQMWLINTVERLSRAAKVKGLAIGLYEGAEPNALGVGGARDEALLALSSGLLSGAIPQDEIEAVLAHAISGVSSGDAATIALAQGVVDTFVMAPARTLGGPIDRALAKPQDGVPPAGQPPGPVSLGLAFVLQVLFGFLATLIVRGYVRSRRPRGDAGAAHLAGRRKIKAVLDRLKGAPPPVLSPDLAAFAVRAKSAGAFGTQPSMEQRLEALPPK